MKGNFVSSPKGGVKYCSLSTYPRTGYVQYAHTLAFIDVMVSMLHRLVSQGRSQKVLY